MSRDGGALRHDLIATYGAQAWIAAMGVAFVPVYLHYLGIEAYGLIGLFATLQVTMSILDFGMAPTLTRELAQYRGGAREVQHVRDLLRSVETIAGTLALVVAVGFWFLSDWLAAGWFHGHGVPPAVLARSLAIIGAVIGLRFVESLFRSALLGLQRQLSYNAIAAAVATARGAGAGAVVAFVTPSVDAFFLWQAAVSVVSLAAMVAATYAGLPRAPRAARFSAATLRSVWRFAAGMAGISVLAVILVQVDKLLLSRLLPLADYGRFMLATTAAGAIELLVAPILQVFGPRVFRYPADDPELVALYHQGSQLITVLVGTPAIALIVFADTLLSLWTGNPALAGEVAPVLRVLAFGYLMNVLVRLPYQVQLAHGWLQLMLRSNIVAVVIIVPALFWIVPHYGTIGAAWVWAGLNAGYLLITMQVMYRRLLRAEKWRWYWQDVARPLGAAAITIIALSAVTPPATTNGIVRLLTLVIVGSVGLAAAVLAAPHVRAQLSVVLARLPGRRR